MNDIGNLSGQSKLFIGNYVCSIYFKNQTPASGMRAAILKNLTMLGKWMTSGSTKMPHWISTLFNLSLSIFLFSLNFWLSLSVLLRLILTVFTRSLSVSGEEQNPRVHILPFSVTSPMPVFLNLNNRVLSDNTILVLWFSDIIEAMSIIQRCVSICTISHNQ